MSPRSARTTGLQDELDRLLHAHEEPRHVGVRHRHGTPGRDLAPEGRDHAASTAEHVTETHGAVSLVLGGVRQQKLLADTLGRAHHARRTHRLVRRNEDEPLGVELRRRFKDVVHPEDVRRDRLDDVGLEDRDVLVRSGVKDDFGLPAREDLENGVSP